MKFTGINGELFAAQNAGYKPDFNFSREIDEDVAAEYKREHHDPYGNRISNEYDSLYDMESGLYQGEDGEMYIVHFVYLNGAMKPLCWHRLKKGE